MLFKLWYVASGTNTKGTKTEWNNGLLTLQIITVTVQLTAVLRF